LDSVTTLILNLILFDGVCNFCNSSVNFIINRDPKNEFKFSPLQSEYSKSVGKKFKIDTESSQTIILFKGERYYTKSRAALEITRSLSGLWPIFYLFIIVPPFIRDFCYDLIAKNRYTWFGKKDQCMVPTEKIKDRFIL